MVGVEHSIEAKALRELTTVALTKASPAAAVYRTKIALFDEELPIAGPVVVKNGNAASNRRERAETIIPLKASWVGPFGLEVRRRT